MKKILILLLLPLTLLGQKQAVVHITTDAYPAETRWVLHADSLNGPIIGDVNYGHYSDGFTVHTDTLYIADTITNVTFVIYDSYGDGMDGSYYVSICQDTIISYPTPSFNTGTFSNRTVPSCMPTGPPTGPCVPAILNINLDQFTAETTWEIHDSANVLLFAGGPYSQAPGYQPQFETFCLPLGEISFTIYDLYGDGLQGSLWQGQDGSYYLTQCGDTLVHGTDPAFNFDTTHVFISDTCVPPPLVPGCMDVNYIEYNSLATVADTSCVTLKIYGCTDSTMFNYDSTANSMDYVDSCLYTLTLYDYQSNGWVGSVLNIYQCDDTLSYALDSGYTETFYLTLESPKLVTAEFILLDPNASGTVVECGFSLVSSSGDTTLYVPGGFSYSGPILPFNLYTAMTSCGVECETVVIGCIDSTAYNYNASANIANTCYYNPGCMFPYYLTYHTQGFIADIDNGSCDTVSVFACMDSTAFNYDSAANVNTGCLPIILGCMQPLAFNYEPLANTDDTCEAVVYGCMSQIALNYNSLANTDDGSCIGIVLGCTDTLAFNWDPNANVDNSSCIPIIYGCINPTQFNYNSLANTNDGTCIPYIYGCIDSTMFNYNSLANSDNSSCIPYIYGCTDPSSLNYNSLANTDDFSCILPIYGCMDSTAFNYDLLANTDNGSCILVILGCTDPVALNYCDSCNTDDFSCILSIYGCTDSVMFNFNPLANVDNTTCIPYIFGCTNPNSINYNSNANTEDFSCISYIYGCMDSFAINFDSLANTDNGSCLDIVEGCMDPSAFNYSGLANISDSSSCLYSSNCISGDSIPYWLNDPCYAWVIEVDEYCCNNEWDDICQSTYNYCDGSYTGPLLSRMQIRKKIISVTDLLGRPTKETNNKLLFYIYDDGSVEKKLITNKIN